MNLPIIKHSKFSPQLSLLFIVSSLSRKKPEEYSC